MRVNTRCMTPGHLFVANGRLQDLACDALIVPTDAYFHVVDHWRDAVQPPGGDWRAVRPDGWTTGAVARAKGVDGRGPEVWFVDAISPDPAEVGKIGRRAVEAIVTQPDTDLHARATSAGRDVPLIAVPVLGSSGGGLGDRRGRLIAALLDELTEAAREHSVDVAIVAFSRGDYSALQHRRRIAGSTPNLGEADRERAAELGEQIAEGDVALFFGAGVSMAAGLPSWSDLLKELVRHLALDSLGSMKALGPLEQAELLQVELARAGKPHSQHALGQAVAEVLTAHPSRPSLAHALLAGMRIPEAATTNYDRLYERAVEAASAAEVVEGHAAIRRLPWQRTQPGRPWVLKMHGDVAEPDTIVLSRSAFVGYDARWKPVGSLVQSLMMIKHLLVVGASLTDDNLLRFAYEVAGLRETLLQDEPREIGTVVNLSDDAAFARLWSNRMHVVVPRLIGPAEEVADGGTASAQCATAASQDEEEAKARRRRRASRALTIFLDHVAMYAERDASHLLDVRYALERDDAEAELIAQLEKGAAHAVKLGATDDAWWQLALALQRFGVHVPPRQ